MTDIEFNGKIKALDLEKRVLTMNDELLSIHIFKWTTEPLDEYFRKSKVGFYLSLKYDSETYLIKSAHYWQEGKEKFQKLNDNPEWTSGKNFLPQQGQKFPPRKPRITIGFTISVAQWENVRLEVEGSSKEECKAILGETIDSLGNNHPPTKDLLQKFKARVL